MSRNIVFEGWLTKSPPTKRIWRTKWRRRWFALRQSGELPGQYFLDYYADRNCRRFKGTINLDLCEQVDAGLHMERTGNGSLDPKLHGSVFTIQTQSRIYHLEADCESEMAKWVDAICRVCGLRSTEDSSNGLDAYQCSLGTVTSSNYYESSDGTGPYIPISECITGIRAQDEQRAFTFDPKNIVVSSRTPFNRVSNNRARTMYFSQQHTRHHTTDFSENESNLSDEECKSLNTSQSNIQDWSIVKSFTKLSVSPKENGVAEDGPPVPPRPPKTFTMNKETMQKDVFQGPKLQEPQDNNDNVSTQSQNGLLLNVPRRLVHGAPPSPSRSYLTPTAGRYTDDDDEEYSPGLVSMQYCNLPVLPPAVDRALKPRHSSHSVGHINSFSAQGGLQLYHSDEMKPDNLQYLDLDLQITNPLPSKTQNFPQKKVSINTRSTVSHGKSFSPIEADSAYKTVDFLKTEAFNITRQDAEASRSFRH